jgi:hypothetical protein
MSLSKCETSIFHFYVASNLSTLLVTRFSREMLILFGGIHIIGFSCTGFIFGVKDEISSWRTSRNRVGIYGSIPYRILGIANNIIRCFLRGMYGSISGGIMGCLVAGLFPIWAPCYIMFRYRYSALRCD